MTLTTTTQITITMNEKEVKALRNALTLIARDDFYTKLSRLEQDVLLELGFASI